MECFFTVAKTVAGYAVAPIGRQIGYLIFYNANFKELADRVTDLENKRNEIKHLVEEERRQGKEIETGVQNWLNGVDGLIRDANLLQQDPDRTRAVCSGGLFLVIRHELSSKATEMAKRVVQEQRRSGDFGRVAYVPALNIASISANGGFGNFESRKSVKENIMNALRDPNLSMIGVYGLGGVGKTFLVDEVAKIAKQDNLFDEVVKATVSKNPDVKTIQGEIAASLDLLFGEEPVNSRALHLHERIIKSDKTFLIVLDDIWKELKLQEVGIPFGGAHNGCKLLMTSRNSNVLQDMGIKNYFRLEVLKGEETWSLFKEYAGNIDAKFSGIASQVAKKCGGLPLIIRMMARSLINVDIHAWKDALNWSERVGTTMEEITYSALDFTYDRLLRGTEMEKFFLLCAVGERPFISDLFKYGIGLGIFNNINTLEGAKNRLHNMINALKASCLLQEEDTSTRVKMHDVVREAAISKASSEKHMLIKMDGDLNEWPTVDFLRKCSQIQLVDFYCPHISSKPPEILDCPKLELFHLSPADRSLELHDTIFERMENLKVMDLTGMNFPSLPTSFCFLTGLQTLCLDGCVLENMEAIGALKSLEILSLIRSSMIKLPSEIGKLTHLRM